MTLATNATVTNMKKIDSVSTVSEMAYGELTCVLPRPPIDPWSTVTLAKVSRKKMPPAIQRIGFFSW